MIASRVENRPIRATFPLAMKTEDHRNRLAAEQSPYLLQHASNPVDWFPWGEDAFAKARRENKPIFLSVGYSTCHWCHVMAEESFADPDTARLLNEHFVSIKVDREERPDVDRVYMTFVQATTGGGGWPMSVWLTPDLKPFFGGTYFPPEDRWGHPAFKRVLREIAEAWARDASRLAEEAENVLQQLRERTPAPTAGTLQSERELLEVATGHLHASFDPVNGGFGGAPKFPRPSVFEFLLRHYERTGNADALHMAVFTLRGMASGGIRDHLGGGFHRYSVDAEWRVPHFEKMLYDQAQLASVFLEAFRLTREAFFEEIARETLDYVLREMTGYDGQFFSAEDADSPLPEDPSRHSEGAFYLWTSDEIAAALEPGMARLFCAHYGVEAGGNVTTDPHGMFKGRNILHARAGDISDDIRADLKEARRVLFEVRARRPRPHRDDKTLAAWNALMISALARAHRVLGENRYLVNARAAAAFIRQHLYDETSGLLFRRFRAGKAGIAGGLDDYAFLVQALLDLHEANADPATLSWALALQEKQDVLFADREGGGYFSTPLDAADIVLRMKDDYDGAEPAANSITAMNLLRFSSLDRNRAFLSEAERSMAAAAVRFRHSPTAIPQMLAAMETHLALSAKNALQQACGPGGCAVPT